jgi:hypothetical protein
VSYEIREMCDGWDVVTEVGVLHFTYVPAEEEISALVERFLAIIEEPE